MSNHHEADVVEANELVMSHLYLVQHIVNQLSVRYPRHVDRQELWNAGAYGLVDASRRFDAATGVPFGRYAAIRIRGAILDSTRSRDWASRSLRRELREMQSLADDFEDRNGRQPSEGELAGLLGISSDELAVRRTAAVTTSLLHLDQRVGGSDAEELTLGERVEERAPGHLPEDAIEHRELIGTMRTAVAFLPAAQREVVERYYFRGELLRDIAASMQVTEARVSQIRSEALNAIRAYFGVAFDGVPEVEERAPGRRSRAAFVAAVSQRSTWHSRLAAAYRDAGADERDPASSTRPALLA